MEEAMEQGPDELGERGDERAADLEELTDKPLDDHDDSEEGGESRS